ncbi:circumsporozoite protein-like isoform X2 [Trichomycterus rosablanca]|uniref:circumsporozoite protein-like isoform X2 n=1 Tax=Trichomycterus rosablanca TaxID=2290929 RepID=UPI002F3522A1
MFTMAKYIHFTCEEIHQNNGYIYNVSSDIESKYLSDTKCDSRWYDQFEHIYNVFTMSTSNPPETSISPISTPGPISNNSFWFILLPVLLILIAVGLFCWLKKCRYLQTVCRRPDGRRENRNGVDTNQSNHQPNGETPQHLNPQPNGIALQHPNPQPNGIAPQHPNPQPNGIAPQHPNHQPNGIAPQQSDLQPSGTTPVPNNNTAAIPMPDERTSNRNADAVTMSDEGAPLLDTRTATNRDPEDVEMNENVNGKINPSDNQQNEETEVLNNQAAEGEE